MKNLFPSIIACITVSIIFSSCGQKLSLTKRHYRNGYYVSHTKKANSPLEKANDRSVTKDSEPVLQEKISTTTQANLSGKDISLNKIQENTTTPTYKSYLSSPAISTKPTTNFVSIDKMVIQPKKFLDNTLQFNKKKTSNTQAGDGDDGRSLLWLLILILLILWILGFAGGYVFGGLIHIILVVAVVLFILWLLRIL